MPFFLQSLSEGTKIGRKVIAKMCRCMRRCDKRHMRRKVLFDILFGNGDLKKQVSINQQPVGFLRVLCPVVSIVLHFIGLLKYFNKND